MNSACIHQGYLPPGIRFVSLKPTEQLDIVWNDIRIVTLAWFSRTLVRPTFTSVQRLIRAFSQPDFKFNVLCIWNDLGCPYLADILQSIDQMEKTGIERTSQQFALLSGFFLCQFRIVERRYENAPHHLMRILRNLHRPPGMRIGSCIYQRFFVTCILRTKIALHIVNRNIKFVHPILLKPYRCPMLDQCRELPWHIIVIFEIKFPLRGH